MPTLTIDGKELEFRQGQTIIEAAKEGGIIIPHFCWHPGLSVSGNCRVCLVEIEKMPKLSIACSTYAADGMIVHSASPKALEARNAVMEFLLINHPLDCPICDEAGECKLQEYAYAHGKGESRFEEIKVRKEKRVQLGPYIKFDGDRCISCSRCIRFSDEIAHKNQLTFVKRGDKVTIATFPGESFDNPYSLNTTDICPVGALTNQNFRFKSRVWEMSSTASVCPGCARGCNTEIWVRNNEILRLTPRFNAEVNKYWMCDNGRLNTFRHVNSDDRVEGAYIRKNGELQRSELIETVKKAAKDLRKFKSGEIALLGSAYSTCEDNFMLLKMMKQLGVSYAGFISHLSPGDGDDILIREDKSPNSFGARLLGLKDQENNGLESVKNAILSGKIRALYCMNDNPAILGEDWKEALGKLGLLIVSASNRNETAELAHILFGESTYAEKNGTFVNFQGRIQRIRAAVASANADRAIDGMEMSRWDKFGTGFDRWMQGRKTDSIPGWKIIALISSELGGKAGYQMAEDLFNEMAGTVEAFKGLDYDLIGTAGIELKIKQAANA
jgi:NADH-quinone oxidoreductase subunit G